MHCATFTLICKWWYGSKRIENKLSFDTKSRHNTWCCKRMRLKRWTINKTYGDVKKNGNQHKFLWGTFLKIQITHTRLIFFSVVSITSIALLSISFALYFSVVRVISFVFPSVGFEIFHQKTILLFCALESEDLCSWRRRHREIWFSICFFFFGCQIRCECWQNTRL